MFNAIGIMSGTSLDGIDLSYIKTDGKSSIEYICSHTLEYETSLRKELQMLTCEVANDKMQNCTEILILENKLTKAYGNALNAFMQTNNIKLHEINVVGCHGQTICHKPEIGVTWQMVNGALLSSICEIPVICDFRRRDIAAGGQGAPLTPIYHNLIAQNIEQPVVIINIGGITNLTWIGDGNLVYLDCGPGNTLLNKWVSEKTNGAQLYDIDGILAKNGTVNGGCLLQLMSHPYLKTPLPKTLDQNHFDHFAFDIIKHLNLEDGAATLTHFTVHCIKESTKFFPYKPRKWLITGGGYYNKEMMKVIQKSLSNNITDYTKLLDSPNTMEASAFAYLAVRSMLKLPIIYRNSTDTVGVTGGALHQ